jgi:glycosyltransferase involved in cell wall biosynthesis
MMQTPRFSIVIPARDEERYIGRCLESIRAAAESYPGLVETIVVLNRCSDRTEEIARGFGAHTVNDDSRSMARIRNTGARAATGDVLVTIDADSAMSPKTLMKIDRALSSGKTIGGGTIIRPDRRSAGIRFTILVFTIASRIYGFSGGLFWCRREDFEAIGGFDERLLSAEDVDFARRLRAYGRVVGRPFSTLRGAPILTSCRKFDAYGDWCVLRHPILMWRLWKGRDRRAADAFYYDFKR